MQEKFPTKSHSDDRAWNTKTEFTGNPSNVAQTLPHT